MVKTKTLTTGSKEYSQGFTLLELIVVLAIIALGFAATAVNFSSRSDATSLKSAAQDLTSALRYSRSQAMLTHAPTALDFNVSQNSYQISGQANIYFLKHDIAVTIQTAKDSLDRDIAHLLFFPDGSSIGGRILLEQQGHHQEININWLTGHVTTQD